MDFVEHFEIPTAICPEDLKLVEANSLFQELFSVKIGQSIEANLALLKLKKCGVDCIEVKLMYASYSPITNARPPIN